jgi:RNA polymerase sigma-70 factor, ECF subfamily
METYDSAALDEAIAQVLAGRQEDYRAIVDACEASLRVVVAAILPEQHMVEDVVQDAFVTAYGKLAEYRAGTNFLAWLKAIARYLALNERRRWCREHRHIDEHWTQTLDVLTSDLTGFAERAPDDLIEKLRGCVARLSGKTQNVVEAFYWSSAPVETIAAEQGKTVNWVRVVLHRARAALADCVERKVPS